MQDSEFARAVALHQQGRPDQAIPLYQAFLRANKKHLGAANLLGVALMQTGRLEDAAEAMEKALRVDPSQASTEYNLGTVLQKLGRNAEAADHFRRAIALRPNDHEAYNNLGAALRALGRFEEAAEAYRRAIALKPDFFESYSNLATVLGVLDRHEEAAELCERVLAVNPDLAEIHVALGNALHDLERSIDALPHFDRAVALKPDWPEAYLCAGSVLLALKFPDRAVEFFRRAVALNPKSAVARFRYATCLEVLKLHDEARNEASEAFAILEASPARAEAELSAGLYLLEINKSEQAQVHLKRVLELTPWSVTALRSYAGALKNARRLEEALPLYGKAAAALARAGGIQFEKSLAALELGDFREGWKLYEERFSQKAGVATQRDYSAPRWDGTPISGTLVAWGDQGLGDQILYASMIPDVKERVGKLILEVEPRIVPLFARSFSDVQTRPLTKVPDGTGIAAEIPLPSLGGIFRLDEADFPRRAYLMADRDRARELRHALGGDGKAMIGISWRSANPEFGEHKTARLQDFASTLHGPEIGLVDLQYGETASELKAVRDELGIAIQHLDEIDNKNDIDGLAALIEALDAVVTVSNTTAHIAGALGKPVWILVPHGKGRLWYWFKDRKDSPWYPGARIVRQQPGQPWAELVASIVPEIFEFAAGKKRGS